MLATACVALLPGPRKHPWPSPGDPCVQVDLSSLPAGPFVINDSYPEAYTTTTPCGVDEESLAAVELVVVSVFV